MALRLLSRHGPLKALIYKELSKPFDRLRADLKRFGNLGIVPALFRSVRIGQQENARMALGMSARLALG